MTETVQEFFDMIKADDIFGLTTMLNQDPALVDSTNDDGLPALLFSMYYQRKDVTQLLLRSGAKVDICTAAAIGDRKRVEKYLAADKGMLEARSVDGWTPLHLAAFFGQKDVVAMLLEAGASLTVRSQNQLNNLPLHAAAAGGSHEVVAKLLESGADPNVTQDGGFTPLHSAAQSANVEMTRVLLLHGANTDVRAENGQSPLDLASGIGAQAVVDLLNTPPAVQ